MGKQRIVIRVSMDNAKRRAKALKIAVGLPGVISAALEGEERDRIAVVGEGTDSVALTVMLRKQMRFAELVSVVSADGEKKENEKKEGDEAMSTLQPLVWSYPVQSYIMYEEPRDNSYDLPCCIM